MSKNKNSRISVLTIIAFNLIVLIVLSIVLARYSNRNKQIKYDNNIANLEVQTKNISEQLSTYFTHQHNNMLSKKKYLQNSANAFTRDSAMQYLSESNLSDFQLFQLVDQQVSYVDEDGNKTYDVTKKVGSARGREYSSTTTDENGNVSVINNKFYNTSALSFIMTDGFSIENIDDNIVNTTGQFTISIDYFVKGEKRIREQGIALYTGVTLAGPTSSSEDDETFLLFCTIALRDVLVSGVPVTNFKNSDTALITLDGRFISKTNNYLTNSNTTFWNYMLEVYGSDDKTYLDIQNEIVNNDSGIISSIVGRGTDKVDAQICFTSVQNTNWKVISVVPETSLKGETDWSYTLIMMLFIVFLIIADGAVALLSFKKLKESLKKTEEAVEIAIVANASKSSFLSRMSHEIRTPLNAVIGYNVIAREQFSHTKTPAEKVTADMKVLDCLFKSELASKQLLNIVNDVLDMSAIENGKIKIVNDRFDFRSLITTLTTVFYSQAKNKGLNFDVVFDKVTEEWFVGDQMRINQVLMNLLSNAIKFTLEGGSVTLNITQLEEQNGKVHIRFEIKDTGIGMTEEYISHIWAPFEQADATISRRFGGTGLGLTITKSLVELMDGTITVESTLKKGSTFTVDLMLGKTEPTEAKKIFDFSKLNVLVVDDDIATCEYIRSIMNHYAVKCVAVNSGKNAIEAVKLALEKNVSFSACMVDWKMPEMDGIETIKKIKEVVPNGLPIIVITAYDYAEIAEQVNQLGVKKFLAKPLFQSTLFDLLVELSGVMHDVIKAKIEKQTFENVKLLLAEDNKMNMEIAKNILENSGIVCECAWDGLQVVEKFTKSEPGTYNGILMDIHMPNMDGLQATKTIRNSDHLEAKTIPIIAMTADAFVEDIAETKAAGMNAHIAKPIDIKLLFSTIKKFICK